MTKTLPPRPNPSPSPPLTDDQKTIENAKAIFDAEVVIPIREGNVHQRILKVMEDVTVIQKNGLSKGKDKYPFVRHDDVTAMLQPLFVKYGLTWTPTVIESKYEISSQVGIHTSVIVDVCVRCVEDPKDCVLMCMPGNALSRSDKGLGMAISYAIKYAMLKLFCIPTGEPDLEDHNEELSKEEKPPSRREVPIDPQTVASGNVDDHWVAVGLALDAIKVPKGSRQACISYFATECGIEPPEDWKTLDSPVVKVIRTKAQGYADSGLKWVDVKAEMKGDSS